MITSFDYREFDHDGNYLSNSSFNPVVEINAPQAALTLNSMMWSDADQNLELRPGYGKIRMNYTLGLKPNILPNGDFRLKAVYNSVGGFYENKIDTFGFQLVTGSEIIKESYEQIEDENVAYVLTGDYAATGNAYLVTESINIKMGSNNTLRIRLRFKIPPFVGIGIPVALPYQKVRMVVTYGSFYLLTSGLWQTSPTELVFYATDFGKYIEAELIATRPDEGASAGYDFKIKIYHSVPLHTDYTTIAGMKTKTTVGLPIGTRTESIYNDYNHYYELEENTTGESVPDNVRPNDFHASTNPVQWISKQRIFRNIITIFTQFSFYIDKIQLNFLVTGIDPVDTIIREQIGEPFNNEVLDIHILHGSFQDVITTFLNIDMTGGGNSFLTTTNVLSAKLLYNGYLMDADGNGYENFKRDAVDELTSLHAIHLKQVGAQYNKSWKKITGTLHSHDRYLSFINTLKEMNDGQRLYIPIALTIDDKSNRYTGEYLELMNAIEGGGASSFSSGFTSGFGSGFD